MPDFDFLEKALGMGIGFPRRLRMIFQEKYFSCYILLTKQNVSCNSLFARL